MGNRSESHTEIVQVAPRISTTIQYESPSFSAIILPPTPSRNIDLDAEYAQSYRTETIVSSFASSISSVIGLSSSYNDNNNNNNHIINIVPTTPPPLISNHNDNLSSSSSGSKCKSRRTKTCDLSTILNNSSSNIDIPKWEPLTPPLPAKCRKSVALEVMHRSKIQRRQRPLPSVIDF